MTKADILAYSNTNIRVKTDPSSVSTDNVATSIDNAASVDLDSVLANGGNAITADATIDMQQHQFYVSNGGFVALESGDGMANHYAGVGGQWDSTPSGNEFAIYANDGTHFFLITVNGADGFVLKHVYIGGNIHKIIIPIDTSNAVVADKYIPLSVNNVVSDSAGNIPLVAIADDFINDAAAATGGIAVGGLYHTSGVVKIRLS